MSKKKLMRMTTVDLSLDKLIRGQLRFLSQYFDVVGVAADTGLLRGVAEREGIRVIDVPMHREISLANDWRTLWQLVRLFKQERPDILHCNTPKGSLLGLLAAKIAGVPHRVYTVTGLRYQGATGVFRKILMTMERVACACATRVIPEGQGVLHTLQADRITRKPLRVLHYGNINGIDTTYYSLGALQTDAAVSSTPESGHDTVRRLRQQLGFSDDDFVFVFVGRITKDKGINELAECMRQLDCKLLLVGSFDDDDPVRASDRRFLESSPKVKCVGWQEDVRPYLAAADALVFPSYREGFPNVPIQAGALGKPSIVTDINGCNEIVKDGLNGKIIAAPLTVGSTQMQQALFGTMQWFIHHPMEVKRMSANARGMVTSRYGQQEVWRETLRMYQELLQS